MVYDFVNTNWENFTSKFKDSGRFSQNGSGKEGRVYTGHLQQVLNESTEENPWYRAWGLIHKNTIYKPGRNS